MKAELKTCDECWHLWPDAESGDECPNCGGLITVEEVPL